MDAERLNERIDRDRQNAKNAKAIAAETLRDLNAPSVGVDFTLGVTRGAKNQFQFQKNREKSLRAIVECPFHAMVEVEAEAHAGNMTTLWYANEWITLNAPIPITVARILTWTHPGFQLALTEQLDQWYDVADRNYTITGVKPLARARYKNLFPEISGIYEPGGSVGKTIKESHVTGLKSVKLDMTAEQVRAFISQMYGTMVVTGAPGSGKTTVALQRIRFLFDQQGDRADAEHGVEFSEENTRVFLANQNLVQHSKELLEKSLEISRHVVEMVPEFIWRYLDDAWKWKNNARPIIKIMGFIEERAREAFFSLCSVSDLAACWVEYEAQIVKRIGKCNDANWYRFVVEQGGGKAQAQKLSMALKEVSIAHGKPTGKDFLGSRLHMGKLFRAVQFEYQGIRDGFGNQKKRDRFDEFFRQWLYTVYDPMDALFTYFKGQSFQGKLRIREGTAGRINENDVVSRLFDDMNQRKYGKEMEAWLAWLLRFALPEDADPKNRFNGLPCAISPAQESPYGPWSHVVIDEAQDLSVAEASLLCSFVHPKGALTVSADFHQVVSPVHGMTTAESIYIGCPIGSKKKSLQYPFSRNMRQTREITRFLQGFYRKNFHETPSFSANDAFSEIKPELQIAPFSDFARRIKQRWGVLRKTRKEWNVALIQINQDEDRMNSIRNLLGKEGIPLAPIWESTAPSGMMVTTSVEKIKGLEYDVCFVIGLDDIETDALKFSINRAYVAISRPTRRLSILCEEFPKSLKGIDSGLYEAIKG